MKFSSGRHVRALPANGTVPLERALSKLGLASRGETRQWIAAGRLQVNGKIITDPSFPVHPESAVFMLDATPLKAAAFRLIAFHKPRGCVTTRSDPDGKPTLYDHLPAELHSLHAVGRLDQNTSGLLLLTNDTRYSHYLTDPDNAIPRTYIAEVRGRWSEDLSLQAQQGVTDAGELLQAHRVDIMKCSGRESRIRLTLCEGKNREIRRLCKILQHEVQKLKRISYGRLELGDLAPGQWREVEKEMVA